MSTPQPAPTVASVEPLLRLNDLPIALACSRRTIERARAAGRFPKPDMIVGSRSPRWKPETIRRWIGQGGRL